MNAIIMLFTTGALLLAAEVFLPGAIAGIIGGIFLLVGSILSFGQFGFMGGVAASGLAVGLVVLILYLELSVLPKMTFGQKLVLQATVQATSQPPVADTEAILNKIAEALTTLSPSGYVLIDGRRYEAFCRSGHVLKGTKLRVVGVDNFRIIVSQV